MGRSKLSSTSPDCPRRHCQANPFWSDNKNFLELGESLPTYIKRSSPRGLSSLLACLTSIPPGIHPAVTWDMHMTTNTTAQRTAGTTVPLSGSNHRLAPKTLGEGQALPPHGYTNTSTPQDRITPHRKELSPSSPMEWHTNNLQRRRTPQSMPGF